MDDKTRHADSSYAAQVPVGARAVAALQRAVTAGMTHVEWCPQDSDLDALRERSDFQAFLADLERRADEQPSGD